MSLKGAWSLSRDLFNFWKISDNISKTVRDSLIVMFFHVSLGHFVIVLLAFAVLGLVSSVLRQEIGWEERLRNYLFCVEWDVKH